MRKFFTSLSTKTAAALIIPVVCCIQACTNSNTLNKQVVIEAFNKVLILDSISSRIPDNLSYDDSLVLADRIVEGWVREQVLLAQAEKSIQGAELKFEQKIENYRNALLVSEYENQYVNSRLNRKVTEDEIYAFHEANPELFKLPEHVVRAVFIHLPEEENDLDSAKVWLQESDSSSIPRLEKWCIERNATFGLDTEYWWFLSDLFDQVPLQVYRVEDMLKNRKVVEFTSDERTYLLHVLDHRLKDLPSPLEITSERIEEIIIQNRRKNLLDELRDDLVKEAWSLGLISRDSIPH